MDYDDKNIIPEGVFELEKNWITENFVLFSGVCNEMKDYMDRVDWDNFGTWYVYLYPSEIKAEKPIIIGRETLLDKGKGDNLADYFDMSKEWEFIHKVQPDLFISKQKNGLMIGALNDLNLWCIETEKTKSKMITSERSLLKLLFWGIFGLSSFAISVLWYISLVLL